VKTILTLAFLGIVCGAFPQSLRYPSAIPYTGLSAYSTLQTDALSFTGNQAALAKTAAAGMGIFAERRFMLQTNNAFVLAAVMPAKLGNFGIQLNYAGFKNFNENKFGLAYARAAGSKLDVGIQFNYYSNRIPGYGTASAVYAEAGAIIHVSSKLNAGVHIYNPTGAPLGKEGNEKLAAAYKFGLGYDASPGFFISAEICKEESMPINVLAGVHYQFAKQFFARAGIVSQTSSIYAAFGISWKNMRADVAVARHPQLGISPGFQFMINFKNAAE
jgi:hypothetical protein